MDFSLSEEQQQLRDSVSRFVADNCDVERHRRLCSDPLGFDPRAWRQFAELGWLAIAFSEAQGGIGGNAVDVMVITEALGRGLVREPFLHTAITCGAFLRLGATDAQQAHYIPGIIDGSTQWAFAFAEEGSGYEFEASRCSAESVDGGWRLDGHKTTVLNGHCADYLVVSARCPGDNDGLSLFVVDASLPGITIEPFRSLGAMQALLDTTVEYTRTREQFGQPIGKFQALQHRMADMYLKVEEVRSLLYNAAIAVSEGSAEAGQACAALKVKLAEAGKFVSQEAVQLHGGIGMTDELVVGHHFKRLLLLSRLYGDEDWYLQRYIELGGQAAA